MLKAIKSSRNYCSREEKARRRDFPTCARIKSRACEALRRCVMRGGEAVLDDPPLEID
jgi:hypothetical protein